MALTVGEVEEQILRLEGFQVHFVDRDGRNLRSDYAPAGLQPYRFERRAKESWTVAEWERQRFAPRYPGFKVVYITGSGLPLNGRHTTLKNFRES